MTILRYFILMAILFTVNLSAISYKITEFGPPNPSYYSSYHVYFYSADYINESGQVVGRCSLGSKNYIYLWLPSNEFGYQIDNRSILNSPYINNRGEISTFAINDAGDKYSISDSKLTKNGTIIESSLKWDSRYRLKVNNCGMIAGVAQISNRNCGVIFNEKNRSITNICTNTKYFLAPSDINDLGMVIGGFYNGQEMGFLWTPSFGIQYLEGFTPKAINNHGIIVGSRLPESAVMWKKGDLIDLSKEFKVDTDFSIDIVRLTTVNDINDQNQMCGEGKTQNNAVRYVAIFPIH